MTLKTLILIVLTRASCPWQPDPSPPLTVLPGAAYEELEREYGREDTTGLTVWYGTDDDVRVYLREGAGSRVLCHEWRHVVEGRWHP